MLIPFHLYQIHLEENVNGAPVFSWIVISEWLTSWLLEAGHLFELGLGDNWVELLHLITMHHTNHSS